MKQPRFSQHSELPLPTLPELIPSSSQRYLFEQRPAKLCCGSLAGQGVLPGEGRVSSDQHCGANILERSQRGKPVRGATSSIQTLWEPRCNPDNLQELLRILHVTVVPVEGVHPVCRIITMRDQC